MAITFALAGAVVDSVLHVDIVQSLTLVLQFTRNLPYNVDLSSRDHQTAAC